MSHPPKTMSKLPTTGVDAFGYKRTLSPTTYAITTGVRVVMDYTGLSYNTYKVERTDPASEWPGALALAVAIEGATPISASWVGDEVDGVRTLTVYRD